MSYHVLFNMSTGLSSPITVPKGTLDKILAHVQDIEQTLGYETVQYKNDTKGWKTTDPKAGVSDETFCQVVEQHNAFIRQLYRDFGGFSEKPAIDGELITPKQSTAFWHGLITIEVPLERWTEEYFRARMDDLYETMRGRGEFVTFDSKPLTIRQAADVIGLFSAFIDKWDLRLDVPIPCDSLASSSDGGYIWCERCGAVTEDHAEKCTKRKCPIKEEWRQEEEVM